MLFASKFDISLLYSDVNSISLNTKSTFGNFNNIETNNKEEKEEKEHGVNNFNITGFSNAPFNKTQCTTGKGFFNSNLTTGISFFNKTKFSQFSENRSNSSHTLIPLPSKKKEYYSKKDWTEETKHHPGKWVSLYLNLFRHNLKLKKHLRGHVV